MLLRAFGADVGRRVLIRHGVRVQWPWKLSVADDVWIGEDAWIINLEPVVIGSDVCVSQGAMLCTGSFTNGARVPSSSTTARSSWNPAAGWRHERRCCAVSLSAPVLWSAPVPCTS